MAYSKLEKKIIEIATPVAENAGCYVYDVEFVKEGGAKYLRIFADKEDGGISLDECEVINRALGDLLDREDVVKENYILEVSSPGIERKLKTPEHFERYVGCVVDAGLYKAIDGSKQISGELLGYADEEIKLKVGETQVSVSLSDTTFVKLHFEF